MNKKTLYRFELAFDGVPQDVGILQGLDDTPVSLFTRDELYSFFDSLPIPPSLSTEDDSRLSCWFTEKGLAEFAPAINVIITEVEKFNWQVIGKSVCIDTDFALYSDEFQVMFSRTDVLELTFPDLEDYREVAYVDPGRENPIVFSGEKMALDSLIRKAQDQEQTGKPSYQQYSKPIER